MHLRNLQSEKEGDEGEDQSESSGHMDSTVGVGTCVVVTVGVGSTWSELDTSDLVMDIGV